jgi:hypothetical protein
MLHRVRIVDQRRGARVPAEVGHPTPAESPVEQKSIVEDEIVDHHQMRPTSRSESCEYCAARPFEEGTYRIEVHLWAHEPDSTS